MNTSYKFHWMLLVLMVVLSGCGNASRAEPIPTAIPRPTSMLAGTLEINAIQELESLTDNVVNSPVLQDIQISGHVLLGRLTKESAELIAIDLNTGEQMVVNSQFAQSKHWQIPIQYYSWVQTSADGIHDELYIVNLESGEKQLLRDGRWPDVSEDRIVWSEFHGATSWDIYMYEASIQRSMPVIARNNAQIYPKIESYWVIFAEIVDATNNATHLYRYNILTGEEILLGRLPGYTLDCDGCTYNLSNRRIVWFGWDKTDESTELPKLYVYDLDIADSYPIDVSNAICAPRGFSMSHNLLKWGCTTQKMAGYDLEQGLFFEYPVLPADIPSDGVTTYLGDEWIVWQVREKLPNSQGTSAYRLRLFTASITRQ